MSEHDEQKARARLDGLYLAIFEDDLRGQTIYEDLYRRFAGSAQVHTSGGIDAVLKTYRDAAHREVIEYIVRCCNRARGVNDDTTPEGQHDEPA